MHAFSFLLTEMPWDKPLLALAKYALGVGALLCGFGALYFRFLEADGFRAALCVGFGLFCGAMWFWMVVT